jgi:hypothetical protein
MYSPAYALKKQSEQAPFALTDAPVGNSDLSMDDLFLKQLALKLCGEAYRYHMQGDLGQSIDLYAKSIDVIYVILQPRPILSAEAYTFRGCAYQFLGRVDDTRGISQGG